MYSIEISSHRGKYSVNFENPKIEIGDDSFVLIDSNIKRLFPFVVADIDDSKVIVIEATEENKSLNFCQKLIAVLIKKGIKRNNNLVAIGGGIIQDITGFISSVLFRGIDWVFYPTTLLAQADSCIGSKTSINFLNVKNLVGTFYPPKEINCHSEFLKTLSDSEIKSGIGEILHYYIYDGNEETVKLVEEYDRLFINRDALMPHIKESLLIKKAMIEKDEFDNNERKVFNYGHTFGHAIEALSDYKIPHGQAVTLGMDLANYISCNLGFMSKDEFEFLNSILYKNMPKFIIDDQNINDYMKLLSKDKKNVNKSIVCILASGFGELFLHQVEDKENLKKMILKYFKEQNDKSS